METAHLDLNVLASRETLVLDGLGDVDVVCCAGDLWITLDYDLRDIVLAPGERFRVAAGQRGIVQALGDARLFVQHADPRGVDPARRPSRFHPASTRSGFVRSAPRLN